MGGSLRVAVLGAPGVGKTAIIRQFLFGDYPERHRPTDGPCLYRPAVLLDGAVYDLSIRDGDGPAGPGPGPSPAGPEVSISSRGGGAGPCQAAWELSAWKDCVCAPLQTCVCLCCVLVADPQLMCISVLVFLSSIPSLPHTKTRWRLGGVAKWLFFTHCVCVCFSLCLLLVVSLIEGAAEHGRTFLGMDEGGGCFGAHFGAVPRWERMGTDGWNLPRKKGVILVT